MHPFIHALLLLAAATAHAQIHVRAFAPDGGDGQSWATAYNDLQLALEHAAAEPDQVWVAIGVYTPDVADVERSFELFEGVEIYGGFFGNESRLEDRDPESNPTILSGDLNGDDTVSFDNYEDNSRHVVTASGLAYAVLDGFIVLGGAAALDGESGAGLLITDASPTVANCLFTQNLGVTGGGVAVVGSALSIGSCTFGNNRALDIGGGLASVGHEVTVVGCAFEGNEASRGGGIAVVDADLTLVDSTFGANAAADRGGGVYHRARANAILTVEGCAFSLNETDQGTSDAFGAGLCVEGAGVSATIQGCSFVGNDAFAPGAFFGFGGGLALIDGADATVAACAFGENVGEFAGGGVYAESGLVVDGCQFDANLTEMRTGGAMHVQSDDGVTIVGGTFTGNHGAWDGGAIRLDDAATVVIDGCHFEANTTVQDGAGVSVRLNAGLDVLVTDCTFHANIAEDFGGGIASVGSFVQVDGCVFTDNVSEGSNGGVRLLAGDIGATNTLSSSVFVGNQAKGTAGAGVHGLVADCLFESNVATESGGALFFRGLATGCAIVDNTGWRGGGCNFEGSPGILRDSVLIGNTALTGGALNIGGPSGAVVNCVIIGNHATESGGVLFGIGISSVEATFVNTLMAGNSAGETGGAFRIVDRYALHLINSTLAYNHADAGAVISVFKPQATFDAKNAIVWANDGGGDDGESVLFEFDDNTSVPAFSHSVVQGWSGGYDGPANVGLDPRFVDPVGADGVPGTIDDDLRLLPGSAAIDSGADPGPDSFDADGDGDAAEPLPIDLDGGPRAHDDPGSPNTGEAVVDRGAYEFGGESCYADCNADGLLNILDFVCYQNRFTTGHPLADCDANGVLDMLDFMCYSDAFMGGCGR